MFDQIKQVIVVRSDLKNIEGHKIRTGKLVAQCCHASIAFILKNITNKNRLHLSKVEEKWLEDGQTKICVKVDSEEELHKIYSAARSSYLETHLIKDAGRTEFAEPTYTCLAIGPDYSSKIDRITGELKLL